MKRKKATKKSTPKAPSIRKLTDAQLRAIVAGKPKDSTPATPTMTLF
jgi:hypothetical protein